MFLNTQAWVPKDTNTSRFWEQSDKVSTPFTSKDSNPPTSSGDEDHLNQDRLMRKVHANYHACLSLCHAYTGWHAAISWGGSQHFCTHSAKHTCVPVCVSQQPTLCYFLHEETNSEQEFWHAWKRWPSAPLSSLIWGYGSFFRDPKLLSLKIRLPRSKILATQQSWLSKPTHPATRIHTAKFPSYFDLAKVLSEIYTPITRSNISLKQGGSPTLLIKASP